MKYAKSLIILLALLVLTSCGSSSSASQASGPSSQSTESESSYPVEWVGTYGGAQGTVLTLVGDGTARIGFLPSDKTIDMDSSWEFSDDSVIVHCKAYEYDISANTKERDDGILLFESEEPRWNPEPFIKISSAATVFSKDDYLAMMEDIDFHIESLPSHDSTGWDSSSSYTEVTSGGLLFKVPGYFTMTDSEDTDLSYVVKDHDDVGILLRIQDLGDALTDDKYKTEKYGWPDTFMEGTGVKGHHIMDVKNCRIAGQPARLFTFYANTDNLGEYHVRVACINNTDSGRFISVSILQNLDTLHDFISDYDRMIEQVSLAPDSGKQEETKAAEETTSVSSGSASGYEDIYNEYAKKIRDRAPELVEEYKREAKANTQGLEGLATLCNEKIEVLAGISTEGTEKMAEYMLKHGNGSSSDYYDWAGKLNKVYMDEAEKITKAYMNSVM